VTLELARMARFVGEPMVLRAEPSEVASIYPLTGRVMGRGIGFRLRTGQEFYFWTFSGDRIRELLRNRGFPVTDDRQRPRKIWRGEP
jgi:hypothetical protein